MSSSKWSDPPLPARLSQGIRHPIVAGVLLCSVYVALSFANDPRGFLGTDTGAKVATVKVMSERGTFVPDLGYFAAAADPSGRHHPMVSSYRSGDIFVGVTSLPMVLAAKPLWDIGGYRAALLLPMLGAVAAAFAARALAAACSPPAADSAFWLVGITSPLLLYAVDLWEHAPGVALMLWALVWLHRSLRGPWVWSFAGGAALGVAFSMRTEAVVYAAAMFLTVQGLLWHGRQRARATRIGLACGVGFAVPALANDLLERWVVGTSFRAGRASGFVGDAGSNLARRALESFVTAVSPFPSFDSGLLVLALAFATALVVLGRWGSDPRRQRVCIGLLVVVGYCYVLRFASGPGFVPGALAAAPVAAVALARGWRPPVARDATLLALVPLPIVFAFQLPGGALPQWGGRYFLTTTLALVAIGATRLPALMPFVRVTLLGFSLAVAAFGAAWMVLRTHAVADAGELLLARPEPVLISPDGFPPREFAATYPERRWLTVVARDELPGAIRVAEGLGLTSFAVVAQCPGVESPVPSFPGWQAVSTEAVAFLPNCDFRVTSYVRSARP